MWWLWVGGPYPPSHGTFRPRGYVINEKRYIWTFTSPIAPKVHRVVTQARWTPPTKSGDHVVAWNFISTLPQNLWQPNLAGWWLRLGDLVPPLLTIILMYCEKFHCKQSILQVLLLLHLLLHFWMQIRTNSIIYDRVFLIVLTKTLFMVTYIYVCWKKRNARWACDKM